LETFTAAKEFVENPRYLPDRQKSLEGLYLRVIDRPIVELIEGFTLLPQCFTLQCCYGHFLYGSVKDSKNLKRLPRSYDGQVHYRIAYVAFCLENSPQGQALRESLESVSQIDPNYVQFGSAIWFWKRHRNSYALQVEPERYKDKDQIDVEHSEALHIEATRDLFFIRLKEILRTASR
jgi:hypothetical protein